ncbi:3-isopropylmalate dehydratase large subunit [Frankliniella fusca]|uniref:3-isopropylmalate dehydratase large subunit n=1 Tax=Frankliniella fusca TaxID=407009 RepID=A0AAE1HGK6_9NEOP|nr:3-isopropylmalate dehydratase large subunit [Frankliniella fusca]
MNSSGWLQIAIFIEELKSSCSPLSKNVPLKLRQRRGTCDSGSKDEEHEKDSSEKEDDVEDCSSADNEVKKKSKMKFKGESTLKVSLARKTGGTKRVSKKFPCQYCLDAGKEKYMFSRLRDHLEGCHNEETEVAAFMACTPKRATKKASAIRNAGERMLHMRLFKSGQGEINVKRRPTEKTHIKNYLPCLKCFRLIKSSYLARHFKTCESVHSDNSSSPVKENIHRLQARSAMVLPPKESKEDNAEFRKTVLENMNYGPVLDEILNDATILSYGKKIFQQLKESNCPNSIRIVKDKMRELGRLMLEVKKLDPDTRCIVDIFCASKYRLVVEAGRAVACYQEKENKFKSASYILKLKPDLMGITDHYIGKCLDDLETHSLVQPVQLFRGRIEREWTGDCAKLAHRTLYDAKWNKVQRLPLAEDVSVLHQFLKTTSKEALAALKEDVSPTNFKNLTEVTLCRVMLLNRRRPGECQFMELAHYQAASVQPAQEDKEIVNSLSEMEQALCRRLKLVYIRGKKGRKVPIILTEDLQEALELLVSVREEVGVVESNKYLFAALNSTCGTYRADLLLKKMTGCCPGLKEPSWIKGTALRKHIATMMQLLSLRENELDAVATFLGHNIDVHRHYYRLQESTLQLAKVSKVLLNMERGKVSSMKGLNLDEITVDEEVDAEEDVQEAREPEPEEKSPTVESSDEDDPSQPLPPPAKKKNVRHQFSHQEITTIRTYFKNQIKSRKAPNQEEVVKFMEQHKNISTPGWKKIKDHVWNHIKNLH